MSVKRTQQEGEDNFCDHIIPNKWPPNFAGWKPVDYYISVEQENKHTPCNATNDLKARIMASFKKLNKDTD